MPLEHTAPTLFRYLQTTGVPRIVELITTRARFGTTAAVLAMPDFSAISGWFDTWAGHRVGGSMEYRRHWGRCGPIELR